MCFLIETKEEKIYNRYEPTGGNNAIMYRISMGVKRKVINHHNIYKGMPGQQSRTLVLDSLTSDISHCNLSNLLRIFT